MPLPTTPITTDEAASLLASTDCAPCRDQHVHVDRLSEDMRYGGSTYQSEPPQVVRWKGIIGVEGELTGDGRYIQPGALRWDSLPIPLRYVSADVGAHSGAVVVGRIDTITRNEETGAIEAEGDIDLGSEAGREAARQIDNDLMRGVSMDLDDVAFEVRIAADAPALMTEDPQELARTGTPDEDGRVKVQEMAPDDEVMVTTSARIRAATQVAVPAFESAKISLIASIDVTTPPRDAICAHPGCRATPTLSVSSNDPNWYVLYCPEHAPEHEDGALPEMYSQVASALVESGYTEIDAMAEAGIAIERWARGGSTTPDPASPPVSQKAQLLALLALASTTTEFNWVDDVGGLKRVPYIHRIKKHLEEKGMTEGHAIAVAVNVVKKMCATGDVNFPGKQNVNPASRAEACRDAEEWEAMKAQANADSASTTTLSERKGIGGYPIDNCQDLKDAIQAIGRARPQDRAATIKHIKSAKKELGCPEVTLPWALGRSTSFAPLRAPQGTTTGGQFIKPGQGDLDRSPIEDKPKSKQERVRLLVASILDTLDAVMNDLSSKQAHALIEAIKKNAEAFVTGQMNAPHKGGGDGSTGKAAPGKEAKATPAKATPAKKAAPSAAPSKSDTGGPSLPSGVPGIVAGVQGLIKGFGQNMKPKDRTALQDLVDRLDKQYVTRTIVAGGFRITVPATYLTADGRNPNEQLRVPKGNGRRSGRWVDMPGTTVNRLGDALADIEDTIGPLPPEVAEPLDAAFNSLDRLTTEDSPKDKKYRQALSDAIGHLIDARDANDEIEPGEGPTPNRAVADEINKALTKLDEFQNLDLTLLDEETDFGGPSLEAEATDINRAKTPEEIEAGVAAAQDELQKAIDDATADNPDVNPDDIAHDMAQSISYMIDDPEVRKEFLRREGVPDPQTGWDPMGDFDQPPMEGKPGATLPDLPDPDQLWSGPGMTAANHKYSPNEWKAMNDGQLRYIANHHPNPATATEARNRLEGKPDGPEKFPPESRFWRNSPGNADKPTVEEVAAWERPNPAPPGFPPTPGPNGLPTAQPLEGKPRKIGGPVEPPPSTTYPDSVDGVHAMVAAEMDPQISDELATIEAGGEYEWKPDEGFPGQWGLVKKGTNKAIAIAYLSPNPDFPPDPGGFTPELEIGEGWDEAVQRAQMNTAEGTGPLGPSGEGPDQATRPTSASIMQEALDRFREDGMDEEMAPERWAELERAQEQAELSMTGDDTFAQNASMILYGLIKEEDNTAIKAALQDLRDELDAHIDSGGDGQAAPPNVPNVENVPAQPVPDVESVIDANTENSVVDTAIDLWGAIEANDLAKAISDNDAEETQRILDRLRQEASAEQLQRNGLELQDLDNLIEMLGQVPSGGPPFD